MDDVKMSIWRPKNIPKFGNPRTDPASSKYNSKRRLEQEEKGNPLK